MNLDRGALSQINRAMGVLSIAIGLAIICGAGLWSLRHRGFIATAATATGHVVANVAKDWSEPGPQARQHRSYCAVVHFLDRTGTGRSYQDNVCFSPPSFPVGAEVIVRYDPRDAGRVMIDRSEKVYLIPLVIAVVGVLCVVGGVQRLLARDLKQIAPVPDVPIVETVPTPSPYPGG